MSIARAVLEHCANPRTLGAKILFATHYHELTELEGQIEGVENYNIACRKHRDEVVFLRKIVRGAAAASYGIEVAKLAGVPEKVLQRARAILAELEAAGSLTPPRATEEEDGGGQVSLTDMGAAEAVERLRGTDVNTLTRPAAESGGDGQFSLEDVSARTVADKLREVDMDTLTPIEAMNLLYELKRKL